MHYGSRYISMFDIQFVHFSNSFTVKVLNTTRQAPKFAARNFPENHTLSGSFWWIMLLKKHQNTLFISLAPASVHLWQDSTYVTAVADVQPGPVAERLQVNCHQNFCTLILWMYWGWHAFYWGSDTLRWILTQRDQVLLVLCSCVYVRSIIIGLSAKRAAFRAMMGCHFHIKKNSPNPADAATSNERGNNSICSLLSNSAWNLRGIGRSDSQWPTTIHFLENRSLSFCRTSQATKGLEVLSKSTAKAHKRRRKHPAVYRY